MATGVAIALVTISATAAAGLLATAVIAFARHEMRMTRFLDKAENWMLPHFEPPAPGHEAEATDLPSRVCRVEVIGQELLPNHGKSIKDMVGKIDARTIALVDIGADHDHRITILEGKPK